MGVFDKGVEVADFDAFKLHVENELKKLKYAIEEKTTDLEEEARKAALNTLEIEKQIRGTDANVQDILKTLNECSTLAKDNLTQIQANKKSIQEANSSSLRLLDNADKTVKEILEKRSETELLTSKISADYEVINKALLESQALPESVESAKKLFLNSKELNDSINSLLTHSMSKKSEIDELHKEIFGSEIKSNDGQVAHIDGLIDELKLSYEAVKGQVTELDEKILKLVGSITDEYNKKLQLQNNSFAELISGSNEQIAVIKDELTGLLPGGMAAGLSAAYEKKKDEEIASQIKYEKNFKIAIVMMILVSLIPFSVDIYLLGWIKADLLQVIRDTPSLMISILPLYFPVLWFAYSANKKINLSKRLIEEYTHKAVLGKTFSGLSNQIEALPSEAIVRDELRTKLLFNLLQVSSENPGKLITDYNKTDHPLMDALEKSAKLSDAVDSLSKIPGMTKLAKKMAASSDKILIAETQKVENGLAANEAFEGEDKNKTA